MEIVFILLVGYTGIILGHKRNKNKMMHTLIGSFIMYLGTQGITLLIIYIFGLFNKNVINVINTTDIVNINSIKTIMYLGIIIYMIYDIVY
jgi:hypothetical protein